MKEENNDILGFTSAEILVNESVAKIEKVYSDKEYDFKLFSDKKFGLNKEDLVFLGGRKSIGKTGLVISLMRDFSIKQKIPVGYISCTGISLEDFGIRVISQESKLPVRKISRGELDMEELKSFQKASGTIYESNMVVNVQPNITFAELEFSVRSMVAEKDIQLLFIDSFSYIYEVACSKNAEPSGEDDFHWKSAEIMESLKTLAEELQIAIIVLGEIPGSENAHDPEIEDFSPDMNMFEVVDKIIFLHRSRFQSLANTETDFQTAELVMKRNNGGKTGVMNVEFYPASMRFEL